MDYIWGKAHIGQTLEVLVEGESTTGESGSGFGRTDGNRAVVIAPSNYKAGDLIQVRITDASPNDLKGTKYE